MVIFSPMTRGIAVQLSAQSIPFNGDREFLGVEGVVPSGPIGYQWLIFPRVITAIQNVELTLSN